MQSNHPTPDRNHIFISYRRDDARGASGRLYDWMRIAFGRERVFRDVTSIGVGKWREKIDDALARTAVFVAVIGPRWANADNLARLCNGHDTVRHELVTALAAKALTIVPTLVEGTDVPTVKDLPAKLRPLFEKWNARRVTEDGWEDDTRRLIAEIVDASGLPVGPDLAELLRDAGAAQQRVADLEQTRHLQAEQIDALRRAIDALTSKLAEASATERSGLAAAFAALARGDPLGAEAAFEREYEAQHRAADETRKTMAEAARNVANLALLHDVTKAAAFYRKAMEADPEHAETARLLGHVLMVLGDLAGAETVLSQSRRIASDRHDTWGEMVALGGLGDVHLRSKDLNATNAAYTAALRLAEHRQARDPANTQCQRDLSVRHERIGNWLVAKGDGPGALAAYRTGITIIEALVACDPANTEWQRDLSVSHERIAGVLVTQGDGPGALAAYRTALVIVEALAARDPANTNWQRDLSVSHDHIGDALVAQGDGQGALAAYRIALTIRETLAARDQANTEWQRDVAVSYGRIGNVLVTQGDGPGALTAYGSALTIHQALAARDPANTLWQRDLSVGNNNVGDMLVRQTILPGALSAYRSALTIRDALAARDPANTQWQRDRSVSNDGIGDVLLAQGEGAAALNAYRTALSIREALAARDPTSAEWQRDLSVSHELIGNVLLAQGDVPGALSAYRAALTIAEALAARDPANIKWQHDLSVSHNKIGYVLLAARDSRGALAAYTTALSIAEPLAARDPANTAWQLEVTVSCAGLGVLIDQQTVETRRAYLLRGRAILLKLKLEARLMPNQDSIAWFEGQLAGLPTE